jgi:glutaredoxin
MSIIIGSKKLYPKLSGEKMGIKVYTTKVCPNCKKVKQFLAMEGKEYEEVNITTAEALTELRMNDVFTLNTPIVQIGEVFLTYKDLFNGDELQKDRIRRVIEDEKEAKEEFLS